MATEETTISDLELTEDILPDMLTPVENASETKATTFSAIKNWLAGFFVSKTGNEDIDGYKTFRSSTTYFKSKDRTWDDIPPSSGYIGRIIWKDSNDKQAGYIQPYGFSTGGKEFAIGVRDPQDTKWAVMSVRISQDGSSSYAVCPTPQNGDDSNKIATTEWVNSFIENATMTANSGYVYIGKLLIQWGSAPKVNSNSTITVNLIKPYANNLYFVGNTNTSIDTGGGNDPSCNAVKNRTSTSFQLTQDQEVGNGLKGVIWFAVGLGA